MIRINESQCAAIGRAVQALPNPGGRALPPAPEGTARDAEAMLWLVFVAICQRTGPLRGTVDGKAMRGSDYLLHTLRQHLVRHPERWSAESLTNWDESELRTAVSDGGDPATSTVDRIEERLRLLRDVGARVEAQWGGDAMRIWESSDRRVATLLDRLAEMEAYRDPVRKKSHLTLMSLHECGLWPLADPENLEIAVDYHVMRVALRTGMVEVEDEGHRRALAESIPADEATDVTVRLAVRAACRRAVALTPELTAHRLDFALWLVGRNCCSGEEDPVCVKPGKCWKYDTCSLIDILKAECGLSCPLMRGCLGARDLNRRRLRETAFDTDWY